MSVIKNFNHSFDLDLVSLNFKEGFVNVALFPLKKFFVFVLLLSNGVLEKRDFLLVAEIKLFNRLGQFFFVCLQLLDLVFKRVFLGVLIVVHLNKYVNYLNNNQLVF